MYKIKKIKMTSQILAQGAEAKRTLENNTVIKDRIKKSYRIPVLDEKIRKARTRSEAKIIEKLKDIIPVPKILSTDSKEKIVLEYIDGKKLSDNLENLNYKEICKQISENISKMHDKDIIHGDLTTSNMILKDNLVFFIDFGLAFHSKRIEDKAVDLHLLKQALEAKHFTIAEECIKIVLDDYKAEKHAEILSRISAIEKRGRYRH